MIFNSFVLAAENFPFGTGAASFGTSLSSGSVVYEQLGIASLPHVKEMRGIYDSNFASLLGEFGALGVVLFYSAVVMMLRFHLKFLFTQRDKIYVYSMFLFLVAISVKGAVFMNSYFSVMFGAFLFLPMFYDSLVGNLKGDQKSAILSKI